jgi:hypothetical protein
MAGPPPRSGIVACYEALVEGPTSSLDLSVALPCAAGIPSHTRFGQCGVRDKATAVEHGSCHSPLRNVPHVLWPSWFTCPDPRVTGNFVQRHSERLALGCDRVGDEIRETAMPAVARPRWITPQGGDRPQLTPEHTRNSTATLVYTTAAARPPELGLPRLLR